MAQISYHGTITLTPIVNGTITHPDRATYGSITANTQPQLSASPIQWDNGKGPLNVLTLEQLVNNQLLIGNTRFTTSVSMSAYQRYAGTLVTVTLIVDGSNKSSPLVLSSNLLTYTAKLSVVNEATRQIKFGSANINSTPGLQDFALPMRVTVSSVENGIIHPDAYDVNVTFVIDINITVTCTGQNLQTPICVQACDENPSTCISQYIQYCTPERIENNQVCRDFITNYLRNGPVAQLDSSLQRHCTSKFTGLANLFDPATNATDIEKQICACHMQDSEYDKIRDDLIREFPGITAVYPQVPRCMFPQCVNSPYPSLPMPAGGCKMPECLQISVFDVNGTFDNNSVVVNQTCDNNGGDDDLLFYVIITIIVTVLVAILIYAFS